MKNMRILSWDEFDYCIQSISVLYDSQEFSGVYGFPRGGLCLAVAVSHSLRIPLLNEPKPNALVVDDVYDTGLTLNQVRKIPDIKAFVWLSKVEPKWWNALEISNSEEWFVFPWEAQEFAMKDKEDFQKMRSKI